jgi:hypothetical protein
MRQEMMPVTVADGDDQVRRPGSIDDLVKTVEPAEYRDGRGQGIQRDVPPPQPWAWSAAVARINEAYDLHTPARILFQLLKQSSGISAGTNQEDPAS